MTVFMNLKKKGISSDFCFSKIASVLRQCGQANFRTDEWIAKLKSLVHLTSGSTKPPSVDLHSCKISNLK